LLKLLLSNLLKVEEEDGIYYFELAILNND